MTNLIISRYRIKFKANQHIQLPEYAGSSLRGAFGHALQNIACLTASMNKGHCKCQPVETCLYRRIFDPAKQQLALQDRLQDVAPPFVIEVHSLPTEIKIDQEAHFYITLFGEFVHQQRVMILLAWQRALAIGFGSQRTTGQVQSQLISMELCDKPKLSWHAQSQSQFQVQFLSHARIQHHGKILTADNFYPIYFCRSVVRRYLTLLEAYSDQSVSPDFIKYLFDDMKKVQGEYRVDHVKWSRWSSRQKQKMQMDGLLGEIQLYHVSAELAKILYLGQWLHVGKGCVFGLGQYTLQDIQTKTKFEKISA